jgi:cbb3-type cytochrome oxidase maturation protein
MNSWVFTIPFTFLLAAVLLWLVLRAVLRGDFDDWEGPAARHFLDEDGCPERDDERSDSDGRASPVGSRSQTQPSSGRQTRQPTEAGVSSVGRPSVRVP